MKTRHRLLSAFLLLCMFVTMLPAVPFTVFAEEAASDVQIDAMEAIKENPALTPFLKGETQRFTNDGYIGIPYEVTVYYDSATHGAAKSGYMTNGATPVMVYVVNTRAERIGTDSDTSIIQSMMDRGYIVVVVDYLNHEKAVSPALEWSSQLIRAKALAGDYFADKAVFPSGNYVDTLTVPAGYDVRLNDVFFELDKHGVDGTLEEIVKLWNNDFRGVKGSKVVKWVHADGTRKATQVGFDGSAPVWYSDAAGTKADSANGQYIKIAHTKAEKITDCVKPDGTPIDLNLYSHMVYPTHPDKEVPLMVLYSSSGSLGECINKADRPHFAGFLFNGYAGMIAEYAWIPMGRSDHFGSFSGDMTGGVTGINMTYATYTYNATQSASAALRFARYLALSESDTYRFDVDHVGAYGISKTAWHTQLGAPALWRDLLTVADGKTEAEIAQHVNDKINSFVQLLLPVQSSGRTRYDNGDVTTVTVDGATIDGGELQPWAVYGGNEISSGVQANYSSCGGFMDYFCEGYAPQFFTANLADTSYTEYGQQNIMINLCRNLNIPALWFEVDIAHTLSQGIDVNHGVDAYDAFFKFMNYYLKADPVSVAYTTPANGGVIPTTNGITVKFIGEVSAEEIEKVTVTDALGNVMTGTWVSDYGETEWTFTADGLNGATAYTLTVPANIVGSNGKEMGQTFTSSFYTRPEGSAEFIEGASVLDETGKTITLTVPENAASGYALRVLVTNHAANTLNVYNTATGDLMVSTRISGTGFHDVDLTDALASYAAGTTVTVRLETANAIGNVAHWEENFNSDNGGMGFKFSELTPGQEIDGELALKVVRSTDARNGEYNVYPNMENAYTFSTNKLIKNGAAVTKADLGRTFLITMRVYDTVSRPIRMYMNSGTQRSTERIDYDRVYYTFQTVANEWCEFTIPYTVYEMKYAWKTQVKDLFVQFTPQWGCDGAPIYLDHLKVEEVFTDIVVSEILLVSKADSDKPVKAPVSGNAFRVGTAEYATWKAAINAATNGSTVTMQSNYTFTDSDLVDLSSKTNLVIDLNGYRLTAQNTKSAPLWVAATNTTAVSVTLKNGTVILGDTPLVAYTSSTAAGKGKSINVNVENVYLTVAKASSSLSILSEGTITAGVKVASNLNFIDSVIDIERENLPARMLNGLVMMHSGNSDLSVHYSFTGGRMIVNSFMGSVFCNSVISVNPNTENEYWELLIPASVTVPKASFKKGSVYASLDTDGTENGYAVYAVKDAEYSTQYGAVPNEYADASVYPFAIFVNEAFINGAKTWKDACTFVRDALTATPGATANILMRGDRSVTEYIGNANWLCYMNGTIVLDLGGKTLHAKTASLFEAGVDANYTGSFDTTLIVKNGHILMGNNNICGVQNNTTRTKNFNVSFEDVIFSVDTENFDGSKRKHLFYAQNNCQAQVNINLTLTDCTIDLRGITTPYTVFNYYTSNDLVAANVRFIGGALIADSFSNVTWYTADATDNIRFEKGENGSYVTLSVPNGTAPNVSLPTKDGIFSFSMLVSDGTDRDVYTLKNDTSASPYGAIPAGYANSTFVIFTNGQCIGGKDTWKDTLILVRETLNAKPGSEVQILMQKNREITSYVGSANWLCYMNGKILLDMNGKTLTAKTTSIFEVGVDANYTGSYKTTLVVKNGTILQGKGNVFGVQNNTTYAKSFDASFENVTFGIDSVFAEGNKNTLFYAQNNCKANVNLTLALTDCTIDLRGIQRVYTVFSFASTTTHVSADISFSGGAIKADSLDQITFLTLDTTNDTFVWGKGSNNSYPTMTLPASYTLSTTLGGVDKDGTSVSFGNGVTEGDYTVYTMVGNPLITKYGTIPDSAADVDSYPFILFDANKQFVNSASSWGDAQKKASNYLNNNKGKTVYILMRKDQNNNAGYKSAGTANGTIVLDLGGHVMNRGDNSFIEANTNGLSEAQCAFTTTIIVKNGYLYAGKSTSGNGHILALQSHGAYNKNYNITFEDVVFGVSATYYNSEKGLGNLILCDNSNASGATGTIIANVILRDCTISMINSDATVVPASTRLFYGRVNSISITIEGGSYEGTMSGITFATLNSASSITFKKDSNGQYFNFNLTAGSAPSTEFNSDRGTVKFVKSGNAYTLAVKAAEFGNAFIALEQYEDVEKYPFIVYVDGTLISASGSWKAAQEKARDYLNSHAGATVYVKMRRDVETVDWFKSAGVFNGTVVLDLGGFSLCRKDNSFMELVTNGLTAEQCQFTSNIIVKNGTLLAGKSTTNGGHLVAIQANNNLNKSFNVTFENVTFGISKTNYNPDQGLYAVVVRDNGTVSGATGKVSATILFKNCTFDFTDSEKTVVPNKDTTVIYTNPSSACNNVDIIFEGGLFKGTHSHITLVNAGSGTTVTYKANNAGEYFKYLLTSGTPKLGAVNTDQGEGFVIKGEANGEYVIGIGRANIGYASVNLGDDLSIRYYVKIHDSSILSLGTLSMQFIMNGRTVTVTDYEIIGGEYVFTFEGIAPQQMADLIDAVLYAGDTEITSYQDYSVKKNCEALLAYTAEELGMSESKYASLKTLVSDLLIYGEAAREYKDYESNGSVTDGIEGLIPSDLLPESGMTLTGNTDLNLHFYSATVFFDHVNTIYVKILADVEDLENVTLTVNGIAYALTDLEALKDGIYRFKSEGLQATEFDKDFEMVLSYNGETVATLNYSVNAYAYAMNHGATSNSEMQTLALALYRYGVSAERYLAIQN